jgi:hypothetical protein
VPISRLHAKGETQFERTLKRFMSSGSLRQADDAEAWRRHNWPDQNCR